jgi:hypothetical protein
LRNNTPPREPLAWFAGSFGALLLFVLLFVIGFGDAGSLLAQEGVVFLVFDVLLLAGAAFGVLKGLSILRDYKASPFRRGVYVFPVGLIDATRPVLHVYPLGEISSIAGPDARGLTLTFGTSVFAFPMGAEAAAAARAELDGAKTSMLQAEAAGSLGALPTPPPGESIRPRALAALDPLQGYANPLSSSDKMTSSTPPWVKFSWALAAVGGVVLGASIWAIRNAKSDDSMFTKAVLAGDVDSLRAYLSKASRHQVEVAQVLLPRAELALAQKVGTVAAVEEFIATHPKTLVMGEAETALRNAMLAELQTAVQPGTLAALDDFVKRHPDNHVDAEIKAARHNVYVAAADRYAAQAPKGTAEADFVRRLVAWSEKKGPRVDVVFHRLRSRTMDKADGAVVKNSLFKGAVSFPSKYFDAKAVKPDEDALTAAVAQRFAQVFPPEILALAAGDPLADPDTPLPTQVSVPTLFVEHGPTWSGSVQSSKNPRGVFVGLELAFSMLFRIPDDAKPVKLHVEGWHLPSMAAATDAEHPEDSVYGDMRSKAFGQLQKKLLGLFFVGGG